MSLFSWFKGKWAKWNTPSFNPRPDCLKAIEDKSYNSDTYACRHKAKDAYKCLKKHGYDVKVVRGPVDGWEAYHIWIELTHEDELYWYDPTWYNADPAKYGCYKASQWKDRKVVRNEIHGVIQPTGDTSPPDRS
jgi:hypothetical protein